MKYPTKFTLGLTAASLALLAGCSNDMTPRQDRSDLSAQYAGVETRVDENGNILRGLADAGRPGNVKVNQGMFLGNEGFRVNRGNPLPRKFETEDGIQLNTGPSVNMAQFAQILNKMTKLRVDYTDLFASPVTAAGVGGDDSTADSTTEGAQGGGTDLVQTSGVAHPTDVFFYVDHSGPLSSLLDYVAGQIGADWTYKGGRIYFTGPQTVTYTLWAPSMTSRTEGSVGGNSETFGSSQAASTSFESSYDYWGTVQSGLSAIMPDSGAKLAINPGSGTITVTGLQSVHDRVSRFIETENARLSRQVAVKLDVLAVDLSSTDSRSGSLSAILDAATSGLSLDFASSISDITGASSISAAISDSDSALDGSSAMVEALSQEGRVTILKSTSIIAANETPTPVSIGTEQAYLAGSSTSTDDDGNEEVSLETGIINNGMNLVLTPRIMSNGEIIMSYNMTLNEVTSIETYETDSAMVQLPEVETRNFSQTVNLDSGDALVLASFDSSRASRSASGPFSPMLWGLGGNDAYDVENTKIIVMMTPVVIEKSNAPISRR